MYSFIIIHINWGFLMINKKILIATLFASIFASNTFSKELPLQDLSNLDGNWHLRVMDGHDVRQARAILDFHSAHMFLNGFDGCNKISGNLTKSSHAKFSAKLAVTKMACRRTIHQFVSKRLHETVQEGFVVSQNKRYGLEGITLKSAHHDLFFKKMGN